MTPIDFSLIDFASIRSMKLIMRVNCRLALAVFRIQLRSNKAL